jgi:hypothetical protein
MRLGLGLNLKNRIDAEWTPKKLGGLLIWLQYNTGLEESDTSFPEDTDAVTKWADQSGEGNHATKSSGGLANYDSTLKSPYFEGSTDSLNLPQQTLSAFSVYVRVRFKASGTISNADVLVEDDDAGNNFWRIQNTEGIRIKIGGSTAQNFTFHSETELAEDTWYNMGLERDGDDAVTSWLNGTQNGESVDLATPLRNWSVDNLKGGDGCYIAELVITSQGLTSGERSKLNTYFNNLS